VDDLSTGSQSNIGQHARNPKFTLVVADCGDRSVMEPLVEWADGVFHVAAVVGMKLAVAQPLKCLNKNVLGAHNVIDLCSRYKKELLLASTSEVYGHSNACPTPETSGCVFGQVNYKRWSYAASKMIDEFFALAYHEETGLRVRVVRIFNTVGPRQSDAYGMVIPTFVQRAIDGQTLLVHGDGKQRRTFGHVSDVVWALQALMKSEAAVGQVVNVGGADEVTIGELALRVLDMTRSPSKIEYVPFDQAYVPGFEEIDRRVPDLTKLRFLTGYQPKLNLEYVIRQVIDERRGILQSLATTRREGN